MGVRYTTVGREDLDRQHLSNVDLVITVGGDGTVLSSSHFLDSSIPLLGVNSDPTKAEDFNVRKKSDERRSFGALCCCTADNMHIALPRIFEGVHLPEVRQRIQCIVEGSLKEVKLMPALNDVLIAHPSPAAVSRFRLDLFEKHDINQQVNTNMMTSTILESNKINGNGSGIGNEQIYNNPTSQQHIFKEKVRHLNVWSSGMWVSTAVGSSAAMAAAGGVTLDRDDLRLQYMIREHLVERGMEHTSEYTSGFVDPSQELKLRWNAQVGCIYVDGSHMTHNIELGDNIYISSHAPPIQLFEAQYDF